jgi:NADH-quinone oxidoreductase subunit M
MQFPLLTILLVFPIIGAVLVMLIPRDRDELMKQVALMTSVITLSVSLPL